MKSDLNLLYNNWALKTNMCVTSWQPLPYVVQYTYRKLVNQLIIKSVIVLGFFFSWEQLMMLSATALSEWAVSNSIGFGRCYQSTEFAYFDKGKRKTHTHRTFRPKLDPFQYHVDCVLKVFQYPSHQFGISYNMSSSS